MKKLIKSIFILFFFITINVHVYPQSSFTMYNNATKAIPFATTYRVNSSLPVSNNGKAISGCAISGYVDLKGKNSLARIILIDEKGEEYLIYEAYPLITGLGVSDFSNVSEETALLDNVIPSSIKIVVENAVVNITSIQLSDIVLKLEKYRSVKQNLTLEQATEKAKRINLNHAENNGTWYAGVTNMSLLPFKSKKMVFGGDNYDSKGFEYYVSGFFVDDEENGSAAGSLNANASPYPPEFDWRNRHGIDWNTSVKHQRDGGSCWAFTAVGAIEALVNLYYNKKIDMDLSEQDVVSCNDNGAGTNANGGSVFMALDYISRKGVVNEECFPFADADLPCAQKCTNPSELVKIAGRKYVTKTEDEIKKGLIFNGPMASAYFTKWSHAMVLVGYGVIKEGDFIFKDTENWNGEGWANTIEAGNPLIGKTYWIFKNSYGIDAWPNSPGTGYVYMVFNNLYKMGTPVLSILPISSRNYTDADIVCEDKDGDGYYYWGIGPKPAHCPSCAPDEPDGDDSNPYLGPMDMYGNCRPVSPRSIIEQIRNTKIWNTHTDMCGDLYIESGGNLTIKSSAKLQPTRTIYVYNGGKLIIEGGSIDNANVVIYSGGTLEIRNNGKLILGKGDNLTINKGGIYENKFGEVILK